jgi:hypothetical protein
MLSLIFLCLVGYGVSKLVKYVKNNPAASIEAAKVIRKIVQR